MLPTSCLRGGGLLAVLALLSGTSHAQLRWVELQPANAPSPRYGHATMFSTPLYQNILFGGTDGLQSFQDTWLWDDTEWHLLATAGPAARYEHTLERNHFEDDTLLLFGGRDLGGTLFGDSWMFDGQAWQQLHFAPGRSPSPRFGHAMTKDEWAIRKLYLFGGETSTGLSNETWVFEEGVWSQVPTTTRPPARAGHILHQTRFDQHLILHGGHGENGVLQDTWKFDGEDWYLVSDTGFAATGHAIEYYSQFGRRRHGVVGGMVSHPSATFEWSNTSSLWIEHEPLGGLPWRTEASVFAGWSSSLYPLFVFGGQDARGAALGDTWILGADTVTEVNSLGGGCGTGPWGPVGPALFVWAAPVLGETLDIQVMAAGEVRPILLGIGSKRTNHPFGGAACAPTVVFDQLFQPKAQLLNGLTTASQDLMIPLEPSLHGTRWYLQAIAPDPDPWRRKAVSEVVELLMAL